MLNSFRVIPNYCPRPSRLRAHATGLGHLHPGAVFQHLEYMKSDHHPILLDTEYQEAVHDRSGIKRFEAKWLREKGLREEVQRAWDLAGTVASDGVLARLTRMHSELHAWDSRVLRKPKRRLRKAQREQY